MSKIKLAICMKDLEYQSRFVGCFMNHYNHLYELHVFTSASQMESSNEREYAVIITGEYNTDELAIFVERGAIILNLEEDFAGEKETEEIVTGIEKYQEVYKIVEQIERLIAERVPGKGNRWQSLKCEMIGVYSLTQEMYQAPFAALLGMLYGEHRKVLILDLQSYSGLSEMEEGMASMGLEDLLSVASSGNYSKSRALECIRHEFNWDYISSTQNNQCLAEGSKELYSSMLEMLAQDLGYEVIIINFGSMFLGQIEMMEECQCLYLLKGKEGYWREKIFEQELLRLEKEQLRQAIRSIEISQSQKREDTWRAVVERWNWGQVGELLRREIQKENLHGAVM